MRPDTGNRPGGAHERHITPYPPVTMTKACGVANLTG